jgi:3-phosphoshikimate 1-carboxyvinyltransferase
MDKCGGKVIIKHNRIKILRHDYQFDTVSVEKDWSSIAFWYEMMAIQKQSGLRITGVEKESVQGDAQVMRIFEKLGVSSRFEKDGLHLSYALGKVSEDTPLEFDLVNTPDLAQPLIVTLAAMERTAKITGLSTLKNKETHRGKALKNELAKIGVEIKLDDDTIQLLGSPVLNLENKVIETYQDHRMAMAFAPLACKLNCITIENPDVVTKSYPSYWEELRKIGFTTT